MLSLVQRSTSLSVGQGRLIAFLLIFNLIAQFCDGLLTFVGLTNGHLEGNPTLLWGFSVIGVAPTLVLAKAESSFCVLFLGYIALARPHLCLPIYGLIVVALMMLPTIWGWVGILR